MLQYPSSVTTLLFLCLSSFPVVGHVCGADFEAGVAAVDITPPVGFRIGGGYGEQISTGVADPLFAKALCLRQGEVSAAIVICDLLSVPAELSGKIRSEASKLTAIPAENIVVAATHNHGSPEYWGALRDIFHEAAVERQGRDPHEKVNYQQLLVDACAKAINEAHQSLTTVSCNVTVAQQSGLAFNRRFHMRDGSVRFNPGRGNPDVIRPAGPVDTELPFILLRRTDEDATPLASLTVFAMHTAVFGGSEFGADFPGHLQAKLREQFGSDFVSLFAEGTAGDINHVDVSETRERVVTDEPRQIGNALAKTIVDNLPMSRQSSTPGLAVAGKTVMAPFTPVGQRRYSRARSLLANQATVRVPFLELVEAWRDCHRFRHGKQYGTEKPLEVQAIRLDNDTALVSLPHEVFVEIGMWIKAASPFRNTVVMSLANDVDYYIPTRRAFEEGSYEVSTCPLHPGCGELLANAAIELLNDLKGRPLP